MLFFVVCYHFLALFSMLFVFCHVAAVLKQKCLYYKNVCITKMFVSQKCLYHIAAPNWFYLCSEHHCIRKIHNFFHDIKKG